jgi:probable F420-dependent oxidoreductase
MSLGELGVWCPAFRGADAVQAARAAAELESLGFGALWIPGSGNGPVIDDIRALLAATSSIVIATSIVSIWTHEPAEVARMQAELDDAHPGRFLLGLGVSHALLVNTLGAGTYRRPLTRMHAYLDALDDAATPPRRRVLAALGPRMLDLARERSAGAHPFLTPVQHTRFARERLGEGPLLAPELAVLLETDADRARYHARAHIAVPLTLPNYADNLRRSGFTEDDLRDGGSNRLVDALVAWGDLDAIRARVDAHRAAGADHVCLNWIGEADPLAPGAWRTLAAPLLDAERAS